MGSISFETEMDNEFEFGTYRRRNGLISSMSDEATDYLNSNYYFERTLVCKEIKINDCCMFKHHLVLLDILVHCMTIVIN